MVMAFSPKTLDEALQITANEKVVLLAGGTDIMVKNKSWSGTTPKIQDKVVFLKYINELKRIELHNNVLTIGSGCTFKEIIDDKKAPEFLKAVANEIASPAIRNTATIGGNICNASPAGDILPPLYAARASVVLQSINGNRTIPIDNFIIGPGITDLRNGEILKDIIVPLGKEVRYYYKKVGARKSNAISKLSFFGLADIHKNKIIELGIAFGAVGKTVIVSRKVENNFKGRELKKISDEADKIKKEYSKLIIPITDQRSTAEYRKSISLKLLEEFLLHILQ